MARFLLFFSIPFCENGTDLLFVVAEFFLAVLATDALVGGFREAFGAQAEGDLPAQEQKKREGKECPSVGARNEDERCEHHREVPVIDAAIGTASVFHKPSLEGAEKQDADHIAHAVGEGDEHENACVDDVGVIQEADHRIERDPYRRHGEGAFARHKCGCAFVRRHIIARKLLLATGAFEVRREETESHFHREDHADTPKEPRGVFVAAKKSIAVLYSVDNIYDRGSEEEQRAADELDEMHRHNF